MGRVLAAEVIRLGLRRVLSAPRLSAVLLTGALLAVGLAASAPIFIEAVRDLGLRQLLDDADPAETDLRFLQSGIAANDTSVEQVPRRARNRSARRRRRHDRGRTGRAAHRRLPALARRRGSGRD